jgi:DNA-binding CsgD family transcriptional regulator
MAFGAALGAGAPEMSLEAAARLRRAASGTERGSLFATVASGIAAVVAGEAEEGVALIRRAIATARPSLPPDDDLLDWLSFAEIWGLNDYEQGRRQAQRRIDRLRAKGNVAMLLGTLSLAAELDLMCGRVREAEIAAAEALSLARASGDPGLAFQPHLVLSWLGAIRGEHDACVENATQALELVARLRRTQQQLRVEHSLGLLALGEGQFDDTVRTLTQARSLADTRGLGAQFHTLRADLVEALLRSGRRRDAALEASTLTLSTTPNDRAVAERARALVDQDGFEARFRAALDWHGRGQDAFEEARTQFCFGERLRRERRRREARDHLRAALATFDLLGARPWAERAQTELQATGEHYRRRDPTAIESLTPQELQVALQVAEGKANRDVATALFLSTKTVEFHLTNVYRKVNVRSRTQLARLLASDQSGEHGAAG